MAPEVLLRYEEADPIVRHIRKQGDAGREKTSHIL
jgi:hypothetical protein